MHGGQTLYLFNVLFAPEIRRNLIFVLVFLSYGFATYFHDTIFELFLNSIYYDCGNLQNGLIVLNVDYASGNKLVPVFSLLLLLETRMKRIYGM